jgi:hypothetical protein
MPVTVTCTGCGKNLKVKDEFLGKRLKCPGCGNTFLAQVGGGGAMNAPSRGPVAKKEAGGPAFHMSPGIIIFLIAFVGIGGTIAFWKLGPGRVKEQWDKLEPQAEAEVSDVINRALEANGSDIVATGAGISKSQPTVLNITFLNSPLSMTMPETVGFGGLCSTGRFKGRYNIKTGEVEADVGENGYALSTGVPVRDATRDMKVTGKSRDGNVECNIDGKPAVVHFGDPSRHAR